MKRPMTLTGGILGLISHVVILIFTIINVFGAIAVLGAGSSVGANSATLTSAGIIMFILIAIALVIGILGLVFDIQSMMTYNKEAEEYNAKKGKNIVAIVFNFLGIIAAFLVMNIIVAVLIMLVLIAAAVLQIVDVCLESKRGDNLPAEVPAQKGMEVEDKIEKLNEMKAQGMITEAEYKELKKKYIQEKIGD